MTSAPASRYSRWMAAMIWGWVSVSKSLLPRKSLRQAANRSPRNCSSVNACRWIIVPMAPSSMTRRSRSSAMKACAREFFCGGVGTSSHLRFGQSRPQAQGMTDRVGELRAIQRVEMKLLHTVLAQALHLFDRHIGGDHAARLGLIIQSVEALPQPRRHGCAAALSEAQQLGKARDRQDAGHQRHANARRHAALAIAQKHIGIEEELRDATPRARIDLALQILQIRLDAARFRVPLRVCRHRNIEFP